MDSVDLNLDSECLPAFMNQVLMDDKYDVEIIPLEIVIDIQPEKNKPNDEIVEIPMENAPKDNEEKEIYSGDGNVISTQPSFRKHENVKNVEKAKSNEDSQFLRKCSVNLHNGVDQVEISNCTKCVKSHFASIADEKEVNTESCIVGNQIVSSTTRFQCDLCENLYSSKLYLQYHACSADKEEDEHLSLPKQDSSDPYEDSVADKTVTKLKSFSNRKEKVNRKGSLKKHIFNKRNTKKSDSSLKGNKSLNKKPMPHICKICSKAFADSKILKKHYDQVHVNKANTCSICNKVFAWERSLKIHFMSHMTFNGNEYGESFDDERGKFSNPITAHSDEKENVCNVCGRKVKNLREHCLTHTKPHICGVCGKRFSKKCVLTYHEQTHRGKWRFYCETCEEGYKDLSHYKYHQSSKTHLKIAEILKRKFERLNVEGRKLTEKVKMHRKTLKRENLKVESSNEVKDNFDCKHCGKIFERKRFLHNHLRSHRDKSETLKTENLKVESSNEVKDNFECKHCGKIFERKRYLHNHLRSHRGKHGTLKIKNVEEIKTSQGIKGDFECNQCDRTFKKKAYLSNHLKFHGKSKVLVKENNCLL